MDPLVRWGKAWVPATKAAALFLLPMPLALAMVGALVAGDVPRLALSAAGLALLWGAGVVVLKSLVAEAHYMLGQRPHPPAVPLKAVSGVMTTCGVACAALAGGHEVLPALAFAVLGGLGHLAFYGRDPKPPRIEIVEVPGVDIRSVRQQLEQAHGRLRAIESAGRALALPEFRDRLSNIAGIGRTILHEIERDPADAARARRFLGVYLGSAEQVTLEYARTHRHARRQPIDENFRQLLMEMETTFAEQHRRLIERDLLSLDAEIEVLNTRLRREGLG
jgi:5-bromo-4-chloroindolyl phosphate hydrolysis protein